MCIRNWTLFSKLGLKVFDFEKIVQTRTIGSNLIQVQKFEKLLAQTHTQRISKFFKNAKTETRDYFKKRESDNIGVY